MSGNPTSRTLQVIETQSSSRPWCRNHNHKKERERMANKQREREKKTKLEGETVLINQQVQTDETHATWTGLLQHKLRTDPTLLHPSRSKNSLRAKVLITPRHLSAICVGSSEWRTGKRPRWVVFGSPAACVPADRTRLRGQKSSCSSETYFPKPNTYPRSSSCTAISPLTNNLIDSSPHLFLKLAITPILQNI